MRVLRLSREYVCMYVHIQCKISRKSRYFWIAQRPHKEVPNRFNRSNKQTIDRAMTIKFILLVNKQGQTRLAQYFTDSFPRTQRRQLESEIVRKSISRSKQCSAFLRHETYKICYRRYASLFFIVGVDDDENELMVLDFIHCLVETLDWHFGNVCELDIMFHLDQVHLILDEMVCNGCIVETNKRLVLGEVMKCES